MSTQLVDVVTTLRLRKTRKEKNVFWLQLLLLTFLKTNFQFFLLSNQTFLFNIETFFLKLTVLYLLRLLFSLATTILVGHFKQKINHQSIIFVQVKRFLERHGRKTFLIIFEIGFKMSLS